MYAWIIPVSKPKAWANTGTNKGRNAISTATMTPPLIMLPYNRTASADGSGYFPQQIEWQHENRRLEVLLRVGLQTQLSDAIPRNREEHTRRKRGCRRQRRRGRDKSRDDRQQVCDAQEEKQGSNKRKIRVRLLPADRLNLIA